VNESEILKKERREVGERLKKAVKLTGLSQGEFAKSLGITRTGLSGVFAGNSRLTLSLALAIENLYKINHCWVLRDEGEIWKNEVERLPIRQRMILDLAPDRSDLERKWWERQLSLPRKKQEVISKIIYWMEENSIEGLSILQSRFQKDSVKFSQIELSLRNHRIAFWNSAQANGSLVKKDDFYIALLLALWSGQSLEKVTNSDEQLKNVSEDKQALIWLSQAVREIEADLCEIEKLFAPKIFARPYLSYQIQRAPLPTSLGEVINKLSNDQIEKYWEKLGSGEELFEMIQASAA